MAVVDQLSKPFTAPALAADTVITRQAANQSYFLVIALALWACGFLVVALQWLVRWRRVRSFARPAAISQIRPTRGIPVQVISSPALFEPGVFGLFRPVFLLPEGIVQRLNSAQLDVIIAHEMCHVRRMDNLTAAIHMVVEAIFWFHPLVWWLGARLVDERERACDEEVLLGGGDPSVYAEGILNVCKFYLESPLPCVSGVTGSNLKRRIETIMKNRIAHKLNFPKRVALTIAGLAAITVPVVIGITNAPSLRAQSAAAAKVQFEVATVKLSPPPEGGLLNINLGAFQTGRLTFTNVTLSDLVKYAYGLVSDEQLAGPDWIRRTRFDVVAKASPETPRDQLSLMTRELLAQRLHLVLRREQKVLPHLVLLVGNRGAKMPLAKQDAPAPGTQTRGRIVHPSLPMPVLAQLLSRFERQIVVDLTSLEGRFEVNLEWAPDLGLSPADLAGPPSDRPSLFAAVQEQLGLKLESRRSPLEVLVVEQATNVPESN